MFETITNEREVGQVCRLLRDTDLPIPGRPAHETWTRAEQVRLLTSMLNGGLETMSMFGVSPHVTIEYVTQTDANRRESPRDYVRVPGVRYDAHVGPVVRAWRTKQGDLVLRLADVTRQGWTTVRLAGIKTITPAPIVQAAMRLPALPQPARV